MLKNNGNQHTDRQKSWKTNKTEMGKEVGLSDERQSENPILKMRISRYNWMANSPAQSEVEHFYATVLLCCMYICDFVWMSCRYGCVCVRVYEWTDAAVSIVSTSQTKSDFLNGAIKIHSINGVRVLQFLSKSTHELQWLCELSRVFRSYMWKHY